MSELSKSQAEMFPMRHIVSNVRKGKYLILHKGKTPSCTKTGLINAETIDVNNRQLFSFSANRLLTTCGLALPFDSLIT